MMPAITSLSPTDIGRPVAWDTDAGEQRGILAAFNDSSIVVGPKGASAAPVAWGKVRFVEKEGAPPQVVVDALDSLARAGISAKLIDPHLIEVAGKIEWRPAIRAWKLKGGDTMRSGGLAEVRAAARVLERDAGLPSADEVRGILSPQRTALTEAVERADALIRPGCTFTRCPNPERCTERCASPVRVAAP